MKSLIAEKVKDGWYVRITDSRLLCSDTDVFKLCKQEGLKVNKELLAITGNKIMAD